MRTRSAVTEAEGEKATEVRSISGAKPTTSPLASRIKKQGAPPRGVLVPRKVAEPGIYKITHGRICLGHVDGDSIYANVGSEVELSAQEAGRMLEEGTVEYLRAE